MNADGERVDLYWHEVEFYKVPPPITFMSTFSYNLHNLSLHIQDNAKASLLYKYILSFDVATKIII